MNFCAYVEEKSYMLVVAHQDMRGSVKGLRICRWVGFVSGSFSSFVVEQFTRMQSVV
jgi:hypothetical protein